MTEKGNPPEPISVPLLSLNARMLAYLRGSQRHSWLSNSFKFTAGQLWASFSRLQEMRSACERKTQYFYWARVLSLWQVMFNHRQGWSWNEVWGKLPSPLIVSLTLPLQHVQVSCRHPNSSGFTSTSLWMFDQVQGAPLKEIEICAASGNATWKLVSKKNRTPIIFSPYVLLQAESQRRLS